MRFTMTRADGQGSRVRAWIATAAALLLMVLTIAVASPAAHRWLHGHDQPEHDDACAVVLLASGITLAVGAISVSAPRESRGIRPALIPGDVLLVAPAFLLLPERGPPHC